MRDRDKNNAQDSYPGSLKLELHLVGQGNPSLTFALFQKIYKVYNTTLSKYAKHHIMTLESHKNHTSTTRNLLQTWKTTRHNLKAWERPNLSGSTTLPTKTSFSKLQTPRKITKNNPRSIFNSCQSIWSWKREREFHRFQTIFVLKNGLLDSVSKNTDFIVKLLWNSTSWFSNQSVDFT